MLIGLIVSGVLILLTGLFAIFQGIENKWFAFTLLGVLEVVVGVGLFINGYLGV